MTDDIELFRSGALPNRNEPPRPASPEELQQLLRDVRRRLRRDARLARRIERRLRHFREMVIGGWLRGPWPGRYGGTKDARRLDPSA